MSDFTFDFGQVQQPAETPQFRACCHGPVQVLRDLADAIRDGTASSKTVSQNVSEATQKLPHTVTVEDAAELKAAFAGLKDAVASKTAFVEAQASVTVSEALVTLHVKAAEVGPHPTPQQREELAQSAMKLNALLKDHSSGSNLSPFLSEAKARAEGFIKQAQEVNPFFGLNIERPSTTDVKTRVSDSAAKVSSSETKNESVAEQKSSKPHEASKNVDLPPKDRALDTAKGAVSELSKAARVEAAAEQRQTPTQSQGQRVQGIERRQSVVPETTVVASVTRGASLGAPSSIPVPQRVYGSEAPAAARSVATHSQLLLSASQGSSVRTASANVPSSLPRTVQHIAPGRDSQPRTSTPVPNSITTSEHRNVARTAQMLRLSGGSTPGEQRSVRRSQQEGGVKPGHDKARGLISEGQSRGKRISNSVQQSKTARQERPGRAQMQKAGAARENARVRGPQRSAKSIKEIRDVGGKPRQFKLREASSRQSRIEKAIRMVHGRENAVRVRLERDGKLSAGRVLVRSQEKGGSLSMGRLQRVVSLLKHLRSLTRAELKGVKPVSYDRPGEMKTALAIRQRSLKLMEKAQGKPLKELVGLRLHARIGRKEGSGKVSASASYRETLARREVRLHIRNLERRLLNFLQSRSELYKRLTTELTLGDLERLISIVGGARAVRGLKRKKKSGELGAVQEADVSNTFVSQLEAAASQGGSGAESGGGSEEGGADSEFSTGAGEEIESETVVVAEGATPNATLTTAIVKTESPPGGGAKE